MNQQKRLDPGSIQILAAGSGVLLCAAFPNFAPAVAALLAAAWLAARTFFKVRLPATPANLALACLACIFLVNPLLSARPAISLPAAMQMLVGLGLLWSVSAWATGVQRLRQAIWGLAAIGILLVLIAPFTVDWIVDKYGAAPSNLYTWLMPLSRQVIHPNIIAGAAAVLLVTLVAFQRFTWRTLHRFERTLLVVASLALGVLLVATQSRGALLGAASGLAAMLLLSLRIRRRIVLLLAAALPVLFVLLYASGIDVGFLMDSSASVRNASGRFEIWSHALEIVMDFPLTGIGFGNFPAVTDLLYPFLVAGPDQSHAHNLYLQIAVDTGSLGLATWLACLSLVLLCSVQAFRFQRASLASQSPLVVGLSAGVLCGQLAMLVHGLTDAPLWATRPAAIVWIIWGLALALPALTNTETQPAALSDKIVQTPAL